MKKTAINICVVSFPWKAPAPYKFISDILEILEPISDRIILVDGNVACINIISEKVEFRDIGISMHYIKDIKPSIYSAILWIKKCILVQIKTSLELIKMRKKLNVIIFFMAYPYYLLPLLTSKILRIKTVEIVTRSKSNTLLSKILSFQDIVLFNLLDGISLESNTLIKELDLKKYRNKILPEGARFINTFQYTVEKKLNERMEKVGFISRIRKEKGIEEFVKAIPIVSRENKNIEFLIGGSGDLLDTIKEKCVKIEKELNVRIEVTGFIKEEDLSMYLNELRVLVLPTRHSEGLPTIILEAMACGTPVIATSVGAIPSVIIDEKTGFIMESNSPECIARSIINALNHPDLVNITKKAHDFVEKNYRYEAAVERYSNIIKLVY